MTEQATIYDEQYTTKTGLDQGKDDSNHDKTTAYRDVKRAMIDLETLGTAPGCVILQIGIVTNFQYAFDLTVKDEFTLPIEEQKDRSIDPETLVWWKKHPVAAIRMMRSYKSRVEFSCVQVAIHVSALLQEADEVWANSPSFDCSILREFLCQYAKGPTWKYYQERDFRTAKALRPNVPYVKPEHAHSALADAQAQVDHLIKLGVWR